RKYIEYSLPFAFQVIMYSPDLRCTGLASATAFLMSSVKKKSNRLTSTDRAGIFRVDPYSQSIGNSERSVAWSALPLATADWNCLNHFAKPSSACMVTAAATSSAMVFIQLDRPGRERDRREPRRILR